MVWPSPRRLSVAEAAWVGALIEGEGWIGPTPGGGIKVVVGSTSVETIATLLRVAGVGRVIIGGKPQKPTHHQAWIWAVARQSQVVPLLDQIAPYLIEKREQLCRVLDTKR